MKLISDFLFFLDYVFLFGKPSFFSIGRSFIRPAAGGSCVALEQRLGGLENKQLSEEEEEPQERTCDPQTQAWRCI